MADLKEAVKKAKHPKPLQKALEGHRLHLNKLFEIQEMVHELTCEQEEKHLLPLPTHKEPQHIQPATQDAELLLHAE